MVDEEAHEAAADNLGEQHLHVRLRLGQLRLDVGLDRAHFTSLSRASGGGSPPVPQQKSGLFARFPDGLAAAKSNVPSLAAPSAMRPCARGRGRSGSRAAL